MPYGLEHLPLLAVQVTPEHFRPNFLLEGLTEPYAEDAWRSLRIGDCAFAVTGALPLHHIPAVPWTTLAELDCVGGMHAIPGRGQACHACAIPAVACARTSPVRAASCSGTATAYHEHMLSLLLGLACLRAGPCARCEVVCADPEAGTRRGPEPLLTLAAYRRTRGRIHFGVLLQHSCAAAAAAGGRGAALRLGMPVHAEAA